MRGRHREAQDLEQPVPLCGIGAQDLGVVLLRERDAGQRRLGVGDDVRHDRPATAAVTSTCLDTAWWRTAVGDEVMATSATSPSRTASPVGASIIRSLTALRSAVLGRAEDDHLEYLLLLEQAADLDARHGVAAARRTSPGVSPNSGGGQVDLDLDLRLLGLLPDSDDTDAVDALQGGLHVRGPFPQHVVLWPKTRTTTCSGAVAPTPCPRCARRCS